MSIIDTYDENAEEYAKSRIGNEDKEELDKFRSMLEENDKVLDIGCAAGRDAKILNDMGLSAVGLDLSKNLLAIARKQNPGMVFVYGDMRELPFENNSFKAIWASAVLHHVNLDEMKVVFGEFRRILKPDGLLYIHTKAGKGKLRTREAFVKNSQRDFELMNPEVLHEYLLEVGFSKLSIEVKPSKSRKNLNWITAFYRKVV